MHAYMGNSRFMHALDCAPLPFWTACANCQRILMRKLLTRELACMPCESFVVITRKEIRQGSQLISCKEDACLTCLDKKHNHFFTQNLLETLSRQVLEHNCRMTHDMKDRNAVWRWSKAMNPAFLQSKAFLSCYHIEIIMLFVQLSTFPCVSLVLSAHTSISVSLSAQSFLILFVFWSSPLLFNKLLIISDKNLSWHTATCKINGNFQRFSTADLYQFTTRTPSERFPFILQVAVTYGRSRFYFHHGFIFITFYLHHSFILITVPDSFWDGELPPGNDSALHSLLRGPSTTGNTTTTHRTHRTHRTPAGPGRTALRTPSMQTKLVTVTVTVTVTEYLF